jgi:hypothetical protein
VNPGRGHPASLDLDLLSAQCDIRRTRRSGPGGQNRNKVETAVVVVHRPSGIDAEASERRSQAENLRNALFRLRLKLAVKIRHPVEPGELPSLLWRSRCRSGRLVVSTEHDDFPAVLAEALDFLAAHAFDLKSSSAALGCTSSQLLKLLRAEPTAHLLVNDHRRSCGLHPLV